MDAKDVLHIIASLTRIIGEKNMIEGLDQVGWRGIESHPVEFFRGYLLEFKNNPIDEELRIELVRNDIDNVANMHGFELKGDEFVDIVPR